MPRILTQDLVPGMVTAEDVYTYNNQLVLLKDMELTDKTITKLEFYSVLSVRIKDESVGVAADEKKDDDTQLSYSQKIKASEEFKKFKLEFDNTVDDLKLKVNDIVTKNSQNLSTEELLSETNVLLEGSETGFHVFDMLQ